jgi:tripartite-type tricarboxylate transporter receptor subunit TctC
MKRSFRLSSLHLAYSLMFAALALGSASAQQAYPSKPIQLVVTTAAGGANDLVARSVAERLSEGLGQPVVVENLPAGNGSIAAGNVARAAPDGHTLMIVVDSTLTINPHLYKNISYDVFKDFTPISILTRLQVVLAANTSVKANNIRELIDLAKANPGKLNYASTGVGTQLHIGMELFKLMTKTDIVHVPYRATTAAMADLMGGRIDVTLTGVSSAKALVEGGKLKALATGSQRSPLMPDVPSMSEAGVPGYDVSSWFAMLGPPQMPRNIVDRLSAELKKMANDPRFVAALTPQGMQIVMSSPEEILSAMRTDSKKWGDVIKQTGTTIN